MKIHSLAIALLLSVSAIQCMEDAQSNKKYELAVDIMRKKLVKVLTSYHKARKSNNDWAAETGCEGRLLMTSYSIQGEYNYPAGASEPDYTPQEFIDKFTNKQITEKYTLFKKEVAQGGQDSVLVTQITGPQVPGNSDLDEDPSSFWGQGPEGQHSSEGSGVYNTNSLPLDPEDDFGFKGSGS